jgi:Holliday junction resolvasome RuvABC endonuclease subunit
MERYRPKLLKVIAFDLGAHMAYAHNVDGLHWGNAVYEGTRPVKLAAIMNDLPNILEEEKFDIMVYETPFARGNAATRSGWGIAGILEACATQADMAVVDVAVPTIKKFATGDFRAPKNAMIKAARKFGYKGKDEHEADAVCLLRYAEANLERP